MNITYREPTINPGDQIVSVEFIDTVSGKRLRRDIHVVYDITGAFDLIGTQLRIKHHSQQLEDQTRAIGLAAFSHANRR
jgi:hypothetical protein